MKMNWAILVVAAATAAACSRTCYVKKHQVAYIETNTVASETYLTFCKGGENVSTQTVLVKPGQTQIELYAWEPNDRPSRYDGSCEDNHLVRDKYIGVPVALTAESFGSVNLCYHEGRKDKISLVGTGQPCPLGALEQAAPVDDCWSLE